MLFSDRSRSRYPNAPVHEVICQLRFPTILTINSVEPADFQEAIRAEFPQYARRQDVTPPKVTGLGGPSPKVEQQPPITNYHFLSADGKWKLNLTENFIALSTLRYPGWPEFARMLDKPLASFIRIYQPAYFQRVGLRYVNLISRQKLGLEGTPWAELIAPAYTGPLREPDVAEDSVLNCGCDLVLKLDSSCQAKIHAGPGRIKNNAPGAVQDPELKFIFDMDLSMNGQTPCTLAAAALETLHGHSTRLFEGAVTDRLRDAMELI
ncbi:TIGR04255 family protein [Dysosmobacter sp.]|uniref:TIGR04255 family protein n=1 Tax=Dysosmobacter sp. TaxID=2591382 RepID=UPI002A897EFC|nr:TIGR04255 family protein [Dysosmobacter sp.]MDY3984810.1 TIGR04255 family protein [Dysosmobacter sp.]